MKKKNDEDLKNLTNLRNELHESKLFSNSLQLKLQEARRTIKTLKKRETDVGYASPPSDCLLGLPSLVEEKEELESKVNAQNEEIEALKLLCDSLRNENDKMLDNFTDDTTVQSLAKESKVYYSKFVDVKLQLEEARKVIKQNDLIYKSEIDKLKMELEEANIDVKKEIEKYKTIYAKYIDLEMKFKEGSQVFEQNEVSKNEIDHLRLELEEANRTIETLRNGGSGPGSRPYLLGTNPPVMRHPVRQPSHPHPWMMGQQAAMMNNYGMRNFFRAQDWNRR